MARSTAPASARRAHAPWGWAVAGGALAFVLALVLFAPAHWLASRVSDATGGRLILNDARGTVWTGSAQLVLGGGAGSADAAALPSRLAWRLRPAASGLRLQLAADCCTPRPMVLQMRPRWGGAAVEAADTVSQWPAAVLAGLGTPWNTLQLEGDMQLDTRALAFEWSGGRLNVAGRAELQAQRVSSRLSTLRPMGSYRVILNGGATPTLQLSTVEGSLQLSGNGQWVGSRLRFNGEATAAPDREAALANLLNIIGRRDGVRSIITLG